MSDQDPHTLTGAYSLDALDDVERRAFEDHLAGCESCRAEVAGLTATAALLGRAEATTAPAGLRERVLHEAARTRQLPPVVDLGARRETRAWYRQPLGIAASFLLVLCIGLGAFAVDQAQRADRAETLASRITAVTTDPGRAQAQQPVSSGGTGTLISAGGRAVFRATGLRPLPSGQTYQLWIIDESGARSAGLLGRATGGDVSRYLPGVRPQDTIGMTVEPGGGSRAPTTDPVVAIPVRAA